MAQVKVSMDEVIDALAKIDRDGPEGFTTQDLSQETGHSAHWCREKIREMMTDGRLEMNGKRMEQSIDGKRVQIPVYRIVNS